MAVTITVADLAEAIRVGTSAEETTEVTRLLAYATEAIERHLGTAYATTADVVVNEAAIRICAYLYDQPNTSRGGFTHAMRNSGAGRMLLPYVVHGLGTTAEATAAADTAMGSADNPVTGISVSGTTLTVTFADGTTDTETLPAGGPGEGLDEAAVDARVAAGIATHAALPNVHHTPPTVPDPYVLPAAAAGTRGGVRAVTNEIIDAGTSTGIFGWAISHVRRVVNAIVPDWARTQATLIPPAKLGNGTADATTYLRGDNTWGTPPSTAGVARHTISFAASSYEFTNGFARLTGTYPAGTDQTYFTGRLRTGYIYRDPQLADFQSGPLTDISAQEMQDYAAGVTLTFQGLNVRIAFPMALDANQRDNWSASVSSIG